MTVIESLAYSLAPANKAIVMKTMMRRLQINDPTVAEEGYQDYLRASSITVFLAGWELEISGG